MILSSTTPVLTSPAWAFVVGGLRHSNASLALRETVVFSEAETLPALTWLAEQPGVSEAALLTTCNRTEIALQGSSLALLQQALWGCFSHFKGFNHQAHPEATFCLTNAQAERHLFDVAAGLDSLVLGEAQILGQVKDMLKRAQQAGTAGFFIDRLLKAAISSGKRVRSLTGLCQRDDSLSKAAFRWMSQTLPEWSSYPLAVVGGGKMAEIFLQQLCQWQDKHGLTLDVTLINRSPERSAQLHAQYGFAAYGWERLPDALAQCRIILVATGAPHTLLWPESFEGIPLAPEARPAQWLLDLAVPRNVAAEVGDLPNITLLNSDDFGQTTHTTAQAQADLKHQVNTLVLEDWQAFRAWHTSLPAQQALAHVRSHFEAMRQQELANLGPDTEEWLPAMDEFSRGLMNKWLHTPVSNLRQSGFTTQDIDTITRAMHLLFDVPVAPTVETPALPATPEFSNVIPLSQHPRATHG